MADPPNFLTSMDRNHLFAATLHSPHPLGNVNLHPNNTTTHNVCPAVCPQMSPCV